MCFSEVHSESRYTIAGPMKCTAGRSKFERLKKKLFLEQGSEARTGPGAARYLNETRSDRRSRT